MTPPDPILADYSAPTPDSPAAITLTGSSNPDGFTISGTGIAAVDGDYSEFLILGQTQWKKSALGDATVIYTSGKWEIRSNLISPNSYYWYCTTAAATPVGLTYTQMLGSNAPTVTAAVRSAPAALTAASSAASPDSPAALTAASSAASPTAPAAITAASSTPSPTAPSPIFP